MESVVGKDSTGMVHTQKISGVAVAAGKLEARTAQDVAEARDHVKCGAAAWEGHLAGRVLLCSENMVASELETVAIHSLPGCNEERTAADGQGLHVGRRQAACKVVALGLS